MKHKKSTLKQIKKSMNDPDKKNNSKYSLKVDRQKRGVFNSKSPFRLDRRSPASVQHLQDLKQEGMK